MPGVLTESERQQFLAEKHVAVLSVASDGGRPPLAVPIWYHYEPGGVITFFTGTNNSKVRKTRLIERAGAVSIVAQRPEPPYKYVSIEGTLVKVDRPPSAEQMLAIVGRYLPEEMAQAFVAEQVEHPSEHLVAFTIRPDRWNALDFSE